MRIPHFCALLLIGFLILNGSVWAQGNPFGEDSFTTIPETASVKTTVSPAAAAVGEPTGWVRKDMAAVNGQKLRFLKDSVNIRSGPGTSYAVVGRGNLGAVFALIGEKDGWFQFKLSNTKAPDYGYIRKDMGEVRGNAVLVTVDTTNVRAGPSTKHKVLKRADFGTFFTYVDEESGWYKLTLAEPRSEGPPSSPEAVAQAQQEFQAAYKLYTQTVLTSGKQSKAAQAALKTFRQTYLEYKILAKNSQVIRDIKAGTKHVEKIVVSKADFTATVYVDGKIARVFPVAYGANPDGLNKRKSGDSRTPEGAFKIVGKAINPAYQPLSIPGGAPNNPFGTRWMGLNIWGGSIGMHGTSNPSSIGTRASHGCIRMFTPDAEDLFELVRVGTPVVVTPVKDG
jgi:lipoprotein-anchoring transpeptidase ErfK/SrfK